MKIIKHGMTSAGYQPPVWKGVCPQCKCVFEAEEKEIRYVDDGEYRGGLIPVAECPECGKSKIPVVCEQN